jgi:AsmA protein
MRALKFAGAAVATLIVIAAVLLIVGVPSGFLTSTIQERVERETGYRLTIAGSTKISLWPSLNVTLHDITLEEPKDRDTAKRVTVGSVQADVTLSSVWAGKPEVTELVVTHPVIYVPLRRERDPAANPPSRPAASSTDAGADAFAIGRVKIIDGTLVASNLHDRVENRIEGINAEATIGADRQVKVTGSAHSNEHPVKFAIKATMPAPPMARQNTPVEFTIDASTLLQAQLSGKAEVRLNGSIVMINGLTGTVGDGAFNGWASVDLSSKPLVKVDLDFQRLDIATSKERATGSQASLASAPWSNAPIDLNGLNYIDAQVRISAAELNIGEAHFAPVAIDSALGSGVLKGTVSNLGAYGGQASAQLIVDVSGGNPVYTLTSDLVGVRALPLLRSVADFDKLDGKMQAKIVVRSAGNSQRAILSNLGGNVFAVFADGAIRGLNVAQMIRSLTSGTLSGWQEGKEQTTDLTQLAASFRIEKGQATTSDLNLVGPLVKMTGAGTIDLPAKAVAFRVEPKLVLTTQGQGRTSDPVGLGIPVVIDGPWAEPRIYPDMAGILDNPDAAYAKLKEMGKGLFSGSGGLGGVLSGLGGSGSGDNAGNGSGGGATDGLGGKLGETLGNLLQQGLGQRRGQNRTLATPMSSTPASPVPADPPPVQSQSDPAPEVPQDSAAMNEVMKQLFNR